MPITKNVGVANMLMRLSIIQMLASHWTVSVLYKNIYSLYTVVLRLSTRVPV